MNVSLDNIGALREKSLNKLLRLNNSLNTQEQVNLVLAKFYGLISEKPQGYLARIQTLEDLCAAEYGSKSTVLLNQLLIYTSHINNFHKINNLTLPDKVKEYIEEDFSRSIKYCEIGDSEFLTFHNYQYLSYLEIINFKRFPVGHHSLEISGFSKSDFFKQSVKDKYLFLKNLVLSGGNKPYFEMHFNPHRRRKFNREGWIEVFELSSKMLTCFPEIKGVFGGSWFFDNNLKKVSPELHYIRQLGQEVGGSFFITDDAERAKKNALYMSKKRQTAYENGEYLPRSYLIIIPRKVLFNWQRKRLQN